MRVQAFKVAGTFRTTISCYPQRHPQYRLYTTHTHTPWPQVRPQQGPGEWAARPLATLTSSTGHLSN